MEDINDKTDHFWQGKKINGLKYKAALTHNVCLFQCFIHKHYFQRCHEKANNVLMMPFLNEGN